MEEVPRPRRRPPGLIVGITTVLLAAYFGIVVWAWSSTTDDPQAGMAVGFLMLVTLFLLGLFGLFWYGIAKQRRGAVWFVFGICALPSLSFVARGTYLLLRWIGTAR
jgi:hypothetical protein